MSRKLLHLRFILGSLGFAVVLTQLSIPIMRAGHATAAIAIVPAFLLGHLVFGPSLARSRPDARTRASDVALAAATFFLSSAITWVLFLLLDAAYDGMSDSLAMRLTLALPLIYLAISSAVLECLSRVREDEARSELAAE
ncbi:MAG TPA: hypothetical protein VFJ16_15340 [Longimicrobium sp.]|nr:hypothetical protein [Longimicrobium sp.]